MQKSHHGFDRVALNLYLNLGRTAFLTPSSVPIHEHGMLARLLKSSVSFTNVSQFSKYKSYTFFCYINTYFIQFDANVNGTFHIFYF